MLLLGSRLKEPDTAVNAFATARVGNGMRAKGANAHPDLVPGEAPRSQKVVGASRRRAAPGSQFVESLVFGAASVAAAKFESQIRLRFVPSREVRLCLVRKSHLCH